MPPARPCLLGACLGAFLVICAPAAAALERDKAITQYIHDIWQTRDGLPQNTITAIAQTSNG